MLFYRLESQSEKLFFGNCKKKWHMTLDTGHLTPDTWLILLLVYCIGATFCTCQEIQSLPNAEFSFKCTIEKYYYVSTKITIQSLTLYIWESSNESQGRVFTIF